MFLYFLHNGFQYLRRAIDEKFAGKLFSSPLSILYIYQARVVINFPVIKMLIGPFIIAILNRILFAKRMAGPVRRQQYPPEIGMALELNPEHVIGFAFHPIGPIPYRCNTG